MNFLNCLGYLLIVGIAIFLIGRLFPRRWISADRFIFRSFAFEKEGKIYDKIKISKWKTKLPDMSVLITKIIPRFMKKKRVETGNIEELKNIVEGNLQSRNDPYHRRTFWNPMSLYLEMAWGNSRVFMLADMQLSFHSDTKIQQTENQKNDFNA